MTLGDMLIAGRERLLERGLGASDVLNKTILVNPPLAAPDVVTELKRAVNALKATAMDSDGSRVDYSRLCQSEAYLAYQACTATLREFDPQSLRTRTEKLTFWINLYNALVIDAVIALGVQDSIAGKLWGLSFFRRAAYEVDGQRVSCDDIEHGILRANRGHPLIPGPQFAASDPRCAWMIVPLDVRIHFALNCASRSCPVIAVYDLAQTDVQLESATRQFVATEVRVDPSQGEIHLSRIFRWYSMDFGGRSGIIPFLLRYMPDDEGRAWLHWITHTARRQGAKLVYLPYDWRLNVRQRI